MTVVNQILSRLDNINKPQEKFLQVFAFSAAQTPLALARKKGESGKTRIDFYLEHLQTVAASLPESVKYGIFDGFYAKQKFVQGVCQLGFHLISRLRVDAHLKYLYDGSQKPRGAKRAI